MMSHFLRLNLSAICLFVIFCIFCFRKEPYLSHFQKSTFGTTMKVCFSSSVGTEEKEVKTGASITFMCFGPTCEAVVGFGHILLRLLSCLCIQWHHIRGCLDTRHEPWVKSAFDVLYKCNNKAVRNILGDIISLSLDVVETISCKSSEELTRLVAKEVSQQVNSHPAHLEFWEQRGRPAAVAAASPPQSKENDETHHKNDSKISC